MTVIECENVSVYYNSKQKPVLKNISCSLSSFSYVGIIGPNGGGKTTFLKILLGLKKISQGKLLLWGHRPHNFSSKIGYVPQFPMFDKNYPISVLDVVLMGLIGKNFWKFSSKDRRKALESLDRVSLASEENSPIACLSGGQIQRVLLARALVSDPLLLLLDEPTSSIDSRIEEDFYKILKELNQEMTILLVSHDIGIVTREVTDIICVNQSLSIHKAETITRSSLTDLYKNPVKCVDHHCQI